MISVRPLQLVWVGAEVWVVAVVHAECKAGAQVPQSRRLGLCTEDSPEVLAPPMPSCSQTLALSQNPSSPTAEVRNPHSPCL